MNFIIYILNSLMLLSIIEQISKMLFTSLLKMVVIRMLVFKTSHNPNVKNVGDNVMSAKNISKLIGEIYVVGFFIGSNLGKITEQLKKIIINQFTTNPGLSKWSSKIRELDNKIQSAYDKIVPKKGVAVDQ